MYPLAACRITIRFNWCLGCCGKCKIMRIANFYLRIFSCSELTQFEKVSDKWSTSILVGHHKRSAEKGGMGSIYNWTALGLILFPPKWLHFGNNVQLWKQLQFAYTHTHKKNSSWETTWLQGGGRGRWVYFLLLWFILFSVCLFSMSGE